MGTKNQHRIYSRKSRLIDENHDDNNRREDNDLNEGSDKRLRGFGMPWGLQKSFVHETPVTTVDDLMGDGLSSL
ncbi:hypothetical protein TNCV_949481 [Trichonephila clavipes]|nr:hypothetical protein TNCV_949481 [Trichonephila clavipes]